MDDSEAAVLAGLLGGLTTQSTGRVFRGAATDKQKALRAQATAEMTCPL